MINWSYFKGWKPHHYIDMLLWYLLPESWYWKLPDHCEVCRGERGGVRGNENIEVVEGREVRMCDYCSAQRILQERSETRELVP